MSRRYPLDPPGEELDPRARSRQGWLAEDSVAMRLAAAVADILLDIGEWRRRHLDLSQAVVGLTLLALGLSLGGTAAIIDSYLHRGVESGAEQPYIVQPTGKGLATNIDLRTYSGQGLLDFAEILHEGGFLYARQVFPWSEIEPSRGSYDWTRFDAIVDALSRQQIGVIAVIVDAPEWSRPVGASSFADAPPRDPEFLQAFASELSGRYRSRVPFIQVWDRPNLSANWGGEAATGATFAPYLEAAWRGSRAGDASSRVLSPELAVTPDIDDGLTDLQFLADLYLAGAAPYFDLVGIALDGGTYSPDDRRVNEDRANFSRAVLYRELMVNEGDRGTPIWATSYGWALSAAISPEEQAEFVERGMERSWSEWPWMGLMVHWAFLAPQDSPKAPYSVLTTGGGATPLYYRLTSEALASRSRVANTGFAPMDSESVTDTGNWQDQHLEGRTFRTTRQVGASTTIEFEGTGLIAYVRSGPGTGAFQIEIDGEVVPGGYGEDGDEWRLDYFSATNDFPQRLVSGLADTRHTLRITLLSEGELTLGGFEVTREAPFVWPIVLMTVGSIISLFFALRSIAYLFATRAGHLRRKFDPDPGPQLPRLPNWRPERRVAR